MTVKWRPETGDKAVDLRSTGRSFEPDRCGETVTVYRITQTMVITSDGERYSRTHLKPISEGRYSPRQLVRADDDRVLCVRGRRLLAQVASVARNLADLDCKDPADISAALAQIVMAADTARREYADLLAGKKMED
jgi:hypothetical protein